MPAKTTTPRDYADELQAPFGISDYEWRVQAECSNGAKVRVLCYVTARAIQHRLDEVFGPFGWQTSYAAGPQGGVVCRLSVRNPETDEWVYKEDGAENTDIEAVKGGISGSLKRAGAAWGIGRLLYDLSASVVLLKGTGKHFHKVKDGPNKGKYLYWDEPNLPSWAVRDAGTQKPAEEPKAEAPADDAAPDLKAEKKALRDAYAADKKVDTKTANAAMLGLAKKTLKKDTIDTIDELLKVREAAGLAA